MTDKHCVAIMAATIHAAHVTSGKDRFTAPQHTSVDVPNCRCAAEAIRLFQEVANLDTKEQFARRS